MFRLPTIAHAVQEECQSITRSTKESNHPRRRPWDQPAATKLEPLNPPSPYRPSVPVHRYPTVLESLPRVSGLRSGGYTALSLESFGMKSTVKPGEAPYEYEYACVLNMCKKERECREDIVFEEQRFSIRMWVEFLAEVGFHLSNDVSLKEEESRHLIEREEERRYMCTYIEMTSIAENIRRRFVVNLRKQIEAAMPEYKRRRDAIIGEEKDGLRCIFTWFKEHKPFNMKLPAFLLEENKHFRQLPPTMCKKAKAATKRSVCRFDHQKKSRNCSTDSFLEDLYLEAGRRAWKAERENTFAGRLIASKLSNIIGEEESARGEIVMEEMLQRITFDTDAINSMCDVKMRVARRKDEEAKRKGELEIENEKRQAILHKLKEREIIEGGNTLGMRFIEEPPEEEEEAVAANATADGQARSALVSEEELHTEMSHEELSPGGRYVGLSRQEEHNALRMLMALETNVCVAVSALEDRRTSSSIAWRETTEAAGAQRVGALESQLSISPLGFGEQKVPREESEDTDTFREFQASIRSRCRSGQKVVDFTMSVEKERLILDVLRDCEEGTRHAEMACQSQGNAPKCTLREPLALQGSRECYNDENLEGGSTNGNDWGIVHSLEEEHEILNTLMDKEMSFQEKADDDVSQHPVDEEKQNELEDQRMVVAHLPSEGTPSASPDSTMFPMLNIVLSIAAERNPYIILGNSPLSALGEAECTIAEAAGRKVGDVARFFAKAQYTPLCPVYLVRGLWYTESSTGSSMDSEDVDELTLQLLQREAKERCDIIRAQIDAIWKLYNEAAKEASCLTNTRCGDVFYTGVGIYDESRKLSGAV